MLILSDMKFNVGISSMYDHMKLLYFRVKTGLDDHSYVWLAWFSPQSYGPFFETFFVTCTCISDLWFWILAEHTFFPLYQSDTPRSLFFRVHTHLLVSLHFPTGSLHDCFLQSLVCFLCQATQWVDYALAVGRRRPPSHCQWASQTRAKHCYRVPGPHQEIWQRRRHVELCSSLEVYSIKTELCEQCKPTLSFISQRDVGENTDTALGNPHHQRVDGRCTTLSLTV